MKKTLAMIAATLICLLLMDVAVAIFLGYADRSGRYTSLLRYFEYGRSVPGKLQRWQDRPELRDNLFDIAWIDDSIRDSARDFAQEPNDGAPVIRAYGMSFVAGILRASTAIRADLLTDMHGGPAAPPNLALALFIADRQQRRPGDIVVLGVLSSSTPALAALSNRSWAFEQPAPFTYPVFLPDRNGAGLIRIEPLIESAAAERSLREDPDAARAWQNQLRSEDRLYTNAAFSLPWTDHSPFLRLIRRSLATDAIARREAALKAPVEKGGFPYGETLRRIITEFATIAREDGQIPVVFLIQSRDPGDLDVKALALPALEAGDIPYLATVDHFDPRNAAGFVGDGHYTKRVNHLFGQEFLNLIDGLQSSGRSIP